MYIDNLLEKLNKEQIKPVLDTEGAVLVIAGAGSGKTRVLTTRIAYLILEKNVNPSEIVAITFTNKAAQEMKERLIKMVGDEANLIWASTIHSLCVRILRSNIDKLGYDTNFSIYDEQDKEKVLKKVFADLNLDADKLLKSAKNLISTAKNDCLSPNEVKFEYAHLHFIEELSSVYEKYENELNRSNALDFDDLLLKTYELFKNFPEVATYYAEKFKYVHIDEFQDTNKVQFAIAKVLASKHNNIFAVGDDDQSIYSWRGAKIENILSFDKTYPNAKIYKLEQNYRSTKKILELANCIIKNNTERREKQLWTENGEGVKIETFVGADENNEATYTALQIKNLMARSKDLSYKDFAVFMRVNALTRAYEQEFTKYAIPYKIYGGFRFFERKEIKDVLAYLKVIINPADDESFLRSISAPKRGIGEKTLQELREFSRARSLSMYQALELLDFSTIKNASKTKLYNYKLLLDKFSQFAKENGVAKVIDYVLETTDFLSQFQEKSEENTSKIYNINELKNTAEQFERDNPNSTISDYLNSMTLSSDTDAINSDDVVTIATIHAVKGLEYNCVFVAGLDEKILPISRLSDDDDLEEERRLMYVAVTRAKQRLYLTRATSRYMYGKREFMAPSRFLKEACPVLMPDVEETKNKRAYESAEFGDYPFNNGHGRNFDSRQNSYGSYSGYGNSNSFKGDYYKNSKYEGFGNDNYASRGYGLDGFPIEDGDSGSYSGYSSNYAKTFLNSNKPKENKANIGKYKSGIKVKHAKFGEGTVIAVKGEGDNIIVDVAFKGVGIKSLSAKYAPMEILW